MALLAAPQRESLVQRLRDCPESFRPPACEPVQTTRLLKSPAIGRIAALARLWAVPRVTLEAVQEVAQSYHQYVSRMIDAASDSDDSSPSVTVGSPCSISPSDFDDADEHEFPQLPLSTSCTVQSGDKAALHMFRNHDDSGSTVDWLEFYKNVIAAENLRDRLYSPHAPESRFYRILNSIDYSQQLLSADCSDSVTSQPNSRVRSVPSSFKPIFIRCSCETCRDYAASKNTLPDSTLFGSTDDCAVDWPVPHSGVRTQVVSDILRRTLIERQSPLFSKNLSVATTVVLFHLDSDKHVSRYSKATLRNSGLCSALRRYEHSNEFSGCLSSLEPSKFVPLLRDLADVVEDSENREGVGYGVSGCSVALLASDDSDLYQEHADGRGGICSGAIISKGAIVRYCDKRELLTRRAIHALFSRHGSRVVISGEGGRCTSSSNLSCLSAPHGDSVSSSLSDCGLGSSSSIGSLCGSFGSYLQSDDCRLSVPCVSSAARDDSERKRSVDVFSGLDFVRFYTALVKCGTNIGVRYWFRVIDVDGDDMINIQDALHFYVERRREGELRAQGSILCNLDSIWTRLCASAGGRSGVCNEIGVREILRMSQCDREFMLCALLITRVDDSQLVDVAATERQRSAISKDSAMDVENVTTTVTVGECR